MQQELPNLKDELIYASFGQRLSAWAVDSGLVWTAANIIQILGPPAALIAVLLAVFYYAGFESSHFQATPGKMLLKLKVVDMDGRRLKLTRALARNWAMAVSNLTCGYGYLMIIKSDKHQGLHDKIANCYVVHAPRVLGCGEAHTHS